MLLFGVPDFYLTIYCTYILIEHLCSEVSLAYLWDTGYPVVIMTLVMPLVWDTLQFMSYHFWMYVFKHIHILPFAWGPWFLFDNILYLHTHWTFMQCSLACLFVSWDASDGCFIWVIIILNVGHNGSINHYLHIPINTRTL